MSKQWITVRNVGHTSPIVPSQKRRLLPGASMRVTTDDRDWLLAEGAKLETAFAEPVAIPDVEPITMTIIDTDGRVTELTLELAEDEEDEGELIPDPESEVPATEETFEEPKPKARRKKG